MPRLVMKFGGTSVADIEHVRSAAERVRHEVEHGFDVAVVVSAMGTETDRLVAAVRAESALHDTREYDTVLSSGEQVTAGLMALALQEKGVAARSWLGWQLPIRTDEAHGAARIRTIDTTPMEAKFAEGLHAVVAGFQGIGPNNRITTLGRGGSDTTAVALAAALGAERCDIYTDVPGIYTADPRIVPRARQLERIAYEEMLELASLGARVLVSRAVVLAALRKVRLRVRSSFDDDEGTLLCGEEEIVEQSVVTGIAASREEAKVTLRRVEDRPGIAAAIFGPLARSGVNVDMIIQNVGADGRTDVTFTIGANSVPAARGVIESLGESVAHEGLDINDDAAKVSVVGLGMQSHAGVANSMFEALAREGVNIEAISTSEIKISVLIRRRYLELAMRALHAEFELDQT